MVSRGGPPIRRCRPSPREHEPWGPPSSRLRGRPGPVRGGRPTRADSALGPRSAGTTRALIATRLDAQIRRRAPLEQPRSARRALAHPRSGRWAHTSEPSDSGSERFGQQPGRMRIRPGLRARAIPARRARLAAGGRPGTTGAAADPTRTGCRAPAGGDAMLRGPSESVLGGGGGGGVFWSGVWRRPSPACLGALGLRLAERPPGRPRDGSWMRSRALPPQTTRLL